MRWLKKLIRKTIDEVEEEMFEDLDDLDLELDSMLEGTQLFNTLDIPINIYIDGSEVPPMTEDQESKIVDMVKDGALKVEVERFLGEQFKELALMPEGDGANLIRGKIYGISEFYRNMVNIEFETREGVENETTKPEEAKVDVVNI